MLSSLWHAAVYQPFYNILVFLIDILPGHSVGGAIILLTLIVRGALFPLTGKSMRAQKKMRELEPHLRRIREEHKEDKQKQAEHTMKLYQEHGVTPFSGCLPMLIQIPIIIGLYWVFLKGLPKVDTSLLYTFVSAPGTLDMNFLVFDLAKKSVFIAVLAGIAQFFQTDLSLGRTMADQAAKKDKKDDKASFQEDFQKSMQMQMRYVLPVMISFIAYKTSAAVALYWTTSNILSIIQELIMRRKR